MSRFRLLTLVLVVPFLVPTKPAQAQRGELIEGLFRTIAEAQLERERRKRAEAERSAVERPRDLDVRRQFNVPPPNGPQRPNRPPSINVRSREAAEFAQTLVSFDASITPMVNDLRGGAANNPAIRAILPDAYRVAADTRTLLRQCDGLGSLQPIVDSYSVVDAQWRQLSFSLRSIEGLSDRCTTGVRTCDKLVGTMTRQLGIQPQFDRHELHDLMLVAATHMVSLLDDLQLAPISLREVEKLTHDGRLLRQRLLSEADRVNQSTYEEVVTRFTDFSQRWRDFADGVYRIDDSHLHLRLNRIAECGEQTYALLWMPPPYDSRTLSVATKRLEQSVGQLLDQLTIRSLSSLSRRDQVRLFEASQDLYRQCHAFDTAVGENRSQRDLRQSFASVDRNWESLRPSFSSLQTINRATLADIDRSARQLRGVLGVATGAVPAFSVEQLIEVAAALEDSSQYLDADIQRYQRYLQPADYRKSIVDASREFRHHARQLHAGLTRQTDLATLQREAGHMFDGWQQLTKDIDHVESHGLSELRARSLRADQQELAPLVAQVAAALLER